MEKYRRLALLLDKLPDQGSAVWQNADLLIRFRNFFVHFKPSWDHEIGVLGGQAVYAVAGAPPNR
jgi:hypothetical protein